MTTTPAALSVEWRSATDDDARQLAEAQQNELATMNPDDHVGYELRADIEFAVLRDCGRPVACGALQELDAETIEIKRMYVVPSARGRGLARLVLAALEDRAATRGYRIARLETAAEFEAAVGLYTSSGYTHIPAYGEYIGDPLSYCLEKTLSDS